jgi:UDP-N-acetylmuramoyl-tripeptide--D-alanyl-D-alanine ligase
MEVTDRPDGVTIVNDAYNANPDSMRAALRALQSMRGQGRTTAVVGEMLELGEESVAEHASVGALAAELGIDRLVAVGEGAAPAADGYALGGGSDVHRVPDTAAARELLGRLLGAGDVVLLKSSRDSGLRLLGDDLVQDGGP